MDGGIYTLTKSDMFGMPNVMSMWWTVGLESGPPGHCLVRPPPPPPALYYTVLGKTLSGAESAPVSSRTSVPFSCSKSDFSVAVG